MEEKGKEEGSGMEKDIREQFEEGKIREAKYNKMYKEVMRQ